MALSRQQQNLINSLQKERQTKIDAIKARAGKRALTKAQQTEISNIEKSYSSQITKVRSTPMTPTPIAQGELTRSRGIKVATPDIIEWDSSSIPIEFMTDLLFEEIGGQEILTISRNNTINGQNVLYSPIKNLADLDLAYNSLNIFAIPDPINAYFNNFSIKLENLTPTTGTGNDGEIVYVEKTTGHLTVNVIGMAPSDQVEIQILSSGNISDDIVY
jgi:hypothetical protein